MNTSLKLALLTSIVGLTLAACGGSDKAESKPAPAAAPAPAATTAAPTTSTTAVATPAATPAPTVALAKDKNGCPAYPKDQWMSEADAKAKIAEMGYKVKTFEVTGNCYEIYGHDKDGNKAEVYFDAKTLAIVKKGD